MSEASICVGSEFGFGPLGELVAANPNPGQWPYPCGPAAASDLRTDPVQGLWVPPRAVQFYGGFDQNTTPSTLPLNTYVNVLTPAPAHALVNNNTCFPKQLIVSMELTGQVQFQSGDVTIKALAWMGPASATAPAPAALPVMRTLHDLWSDTLATEDDSFTLNLVRRIGIPAGGSVTLTAQLWLYAQNNPGSTVTIPQFVKATAMFFGHGWCLADGSAPVTDLGSSSTTGASTSSYTSTGTRQVSQAAAENGGQVTAVFTGTSGTVQAFSQTPTTPWTGPTVIGGSPSGQPTTVTTVPGTYHTLWKGTDGALWHAVSVNDGASWSAPASLGSATLGSAPQAVAEASGYVHVFWTGTDGAIRYVRYNPGGSGTWEAVRNLGGALYAGTVPAPVVSTAGLVDVFFRGSDSALWHVTSNTSGTSFSSAASLGYAPLGSGPRATGHAAGHVHVFWKNSANNTLVSAYYTPGSGWSGPHAPGGVLQPGTLPMAVTSADATTDVFFESTDGNLWHVYSNDYGAHWSSPASLGQGPITQPYAAARTDHSIDVFWRYAADNTLRTMRYTAATGWPSSPLVLRGSST